MIFGKIVSKMTDFKLKEVKRFLGKVIGLKRQISYLNYYIDF